MKLIKVVKDMKVILYMAISLNEMIAKNDDDRSWILKEEWDSYSLAVRTARNLTVGHRTHNILIHYEVQK